MNVKDDSAARGGWPEDMIEEKYMNEVSLCLETEKAPAGASSLENPSEEGVFRGMETERALVVLSSNRMWHWIGFLFVIAVTLFYIICVILPVLMTGDYASVWPASDKRIGVKASFFYMGWGWIIGLPYFMRGLNWKKITFFNNRVEVVPWFMKTFVIYYTDMRVDVHGDYRAAISKTYKFNLRTPIKLFKSKFIEAIGISLRKNKHYDHAQIRKVMEVVQKSASEFNVKSIS